MNVEGGNIMAAGGDIRITVVQAPPADRKVVHCNWSWTDDDNTHSREENGWLAVEIQLQGDVDGYNCEAGPRNRAMVPQNPRIQGLGGIETCPPIWYWCSYVKIYAYGMSYLQSLCTPAGAGKTMIS